MSELASLCGVTVGPISVSIKKQNLKSVETGQNNTEYYGADALKQLWLHYAKPRSKRSKTNNTQDSRTQLAAAQSGNQLLRDQLESAKSTIEILRSELKTKNSQVDKLWDLMNQARQLGSTIRAQHQKLLGQKSQSTDEPTKHKHGIFNWFQEPL